jgi:asparagine synthase (glutamine-hydrolysing)
MCGITGFVDFRQNTTKEILSDMTDSLYHRGPDACGNYFDIQNDYCIGLGHRRLSIIDLSSSGIQPMHSFDGRYYIVFNGEIYNYNEIKSQLRLIGYNFVSETDTEIIMHSFHEWGNSAIHKFVGMFAFVIYDSFEQTITCYRDRAGVKPFFYYWKDGLFLFASELKALLKHPSFIKEIDLNAVAVYMQLGFIPAPNCIYRNTFKLNPGHYLIFDLKKKELCVNKYWDVFSFYKMPKLKIDFNEASIETEKILEKAFNYRMVSDVPVGVFLSGGYDSTCVTALLQKKSSNKIKTFTIGMGDTSLNEAPYAKKISELLGTDHYEVYCTEREALDIISDLPFYYDEPFADSSAIPTILVSKIARKHVTVALSADGGDEIFGGYDRYVRMIKFQKIFGNIPKPLRKASASLLHTFPLEIFPFLAQNNLLRHRLNKVFSILSDLSNKNLYWSNTFIFSDSEKNYLLNNSSKSIELVCKELFDDFSDFDMLSFASAMDYKTCMANDIMQKVDRATMSVSLEGREPFLDQNIIEWVARLPTEYKISHANQKYILKNIVHNYVDKSLMDRPKMGFATPLNSWLEGELKSLIHKYFDKEFILRQGIFNFNYVNNMVNMFYNGRREKSEKIWTLLMFQMWYEKWIDKQSVL